MRLTSVRLLSGKEPTWQDANVLNVGIAVIPNLLIEAKEDGLDYGDSLVAPTVLMHLHFSQSEGRYVARSVALRKNEVTSTDLREIRVAELVQLASRAGVYVKLDKDDPPASIRDWWGDGPDALFGGEVGQVMKSGRVTDSTLAFVSLVYNLAQISSQPPVKAVEKAFEISSRTAARWVAKAKEKGILKRPSIPGYEDSVEMHDVVRDKQARGISLVHTVTAEDFEKWDKAALEKKQNGEHPEAS